MANSVPRFIHAINEVRVLVKQNISRAFELLKERERVLLQQLLNLELAYIEESARREIELQKLLISREQSLETLKCNEHENTLKLIIEDLNVRIDELDISNEQIQFEWDSELESRIHGAGRFILGGGRTMSYHYKSKNTPVQAFGRHNIDRRQMLDHEFLYPNAIAIDPQNNFIYVCDAGRNRVQVFDRASCYQFAFSYHMSTPFGICIHSHKVYVTQMGSHIITVYGLDGRLIQSTNRIGNAIQLKFPKGICVCKRTGCIYVCDSANTRILILDNDLRYQTVFQCGSNPDDIKLTDHEAFVLECADPCISIYSLYYHQLIKQIIPYGLGKLVLESFNFFLDHENNILIADSKSHYVLVFTRNGRLIHKFGKYGDCAGDFISPRGVTMDREGRVIVASQNPNYCIQFF